jgi:putative flippase GtrA
MSSLRQFLTFLLVGTLAAFVNFGAFAISWNLLGAGYKFSLSLSYILSVVTHFFCNRRYTFKSQSHPIFLQIKKYSLLLAVNYAITFFTVTSSVEYLHLSPYLGLMLAIVLTVGVGYAMSKIWIFKTI